MIGFHLGRLVSAQAPRTPKLGDLLISSGMIDRGILERAIRPQSDASRSAAPSGRSWSAPGSIDPEGLRQVIAQQIEQAVSEVMVWDTGTFEFAIDDLRPIDDIALYPSDVLPDADINTQMVLLEAARIFDERNRDRAEGRDDSRGERRVCGRGRHESHDDHGVGAPRVRRRPDGRRHGGAGDRARRPSTRPSCSSCTWSRPTTASRRGSARRCSTRWRGSR